MHIARNVCIEVVHTVCVLGEASVRGRFVVVVPLAFEDCVCNALLAAR